MVVDDKDMTMVFGTSHMGQEEIANSNDGASSRGHKPSYASPSRHAGSKTDVDGHREKDEKPNKGGEKDATVDMVASQEPIAVVMRAVSFVYQRIVARTDETGKFPT